MPRGRTSIKMDVQPTTSGTQIESNVLTRDLIRFELIARSLSKARDARDRRESTINTRMSVEFPEMPLEERKSKVAESLGDLDARIEAEEKRVVGSILEEILKDPSYNRECLSDLIPNLPKSHLKEILQAEIIDHPMQPIEIKVEEPIGVDEKEKPPLSIVSTSDTNVEKAAKLEAQVLQRVAELRKQGLWTNSRLPLCVDPPRSKTHWDYLLEEVKWMANDFRQERVFKRTMAKKLSAAIGKQRKDQEMEVERAEQRIVKDGRRICANIAKIVKDFWQNVDKMVDYRAQEILESKKRKALDQHLAFIVGEADKLSSMVQEGLTEKKSSSKTPSVTSKEDQDDKEFKMSLDDDYESDNESTLSKEEENEKDTDYKDEISALNNEADGDLDDLLAGLPADYLASLGITLPTKSKKEERSISAMSIETEATFSSLGTPDIKRKSDVETVTLDGEGNGDGRGVLKDVDYNKLNSANADEREQELAHIAEQALQFQPKGFTLETTQVKTQVPFLIRGTLREYQMVGLDWLVTLYEKNLNGILADEMGLGKTIQTISLLAHLACVESIWGPHLIVVPTSVILNWEMELKKWCPALKILTYFGSVKERAEKRKGWSKPNAFHVCITSYKTITSDIRAFKMKAWQYMILDEAQNIKNWKSQRWQALLNIRARRRLLLTGTPLQNSLMELWSLMHFLMPAIFASHDDFKDWFSNPLTGMMEGSVAYNAPLVQRLHKILRPFILRRLKSEVEKQLPEKTETVIKCELSKRQRYLYDDFMSRRDTKENLKTGNMFSVLNIVMQLRKCCNHPNLFEPRPVLSPFVIPPIKKNYPAMVFDIVGENAREHYKQIPTSLDLRKRMTGWVVRSSMKRPTIEELKKWTLPVEPPKTNGFRLSIPALSKEGSLSTIVSPTASILDGLSSAEVQRAGLNQNEQFFVIGENDDRVLSNGDVAHALKVRLEGEKLIVDSSSDLPTPHPRVCRVVTINGEKALVDVSKNGEAGEPTLPEPSSANLPSSSVSEKNLSTQRWVQGVNREMSTRSTSIVSMTSVRPSIGLRRTLPLHTSFKSHTRSYPQNLGILTEVKGFNHTMSNGGSRECITNFDYRFSPPLKRKKVQEIPLLSGIYSAYVPQDYREHLAEEKMRRLELAQARFGVVESPIYSMELLYAVSKNYKEEKGGLEERFDPKIDAVQEVLMEYTNLLLNKFPLYVEPAQTDCPSIVAYSSGRSVLAKQAETDIKDLARKQLITAPPTLNTKLLSSSLQFPELRLIEYDCGKLQTLAILLRQLYLYKHRCLIFTQMSRMLDILQAFLSHHGYQYFRLDGTTGIEHRQLMMERFNADPRIFCFILSTRSGGVGVNLTGADTVIFYDSDWNPTMDAQAQDRCHRIGQTRNVSIYRLISERTIEENILKKATQKRRLGEMAIDDAGFTPEFFKQTDNIRDLFDEDVSDVEIKKSVEEPVDQKEMENVMAALEDEQDVAAMKMATAEAKADKAEFDDAKKETATVMTTGDDSQDEKYLELINQLKPIERYAVQFLEAEYKPEFDEECKEAEALIEQKKEDWVRAHEKANDDTEIDDDFYGCGSILDEILASDNVFLDMPTWCPPTPPLSPSATQNDVYFDDCLDLLYDPDFMGESKLPSTIHELHRPLARPPSPVKKVQPPPPSPAPSKNKAVLDLLNAATMSTYSPTAPSPMPFENNFFQEYGYSGDYTSSGLDPYSHLKRDRRERFGKNIDNQRKGEAPRPITPPSPICEQDDYEGPEWNIVEDQAISEAVAFEDLMGHSPSRMACALHYNWYYVADYVNIRTAPTGHYRSPRQCCIRYQLVVRPREAGHLHTVDPFTKKPRKVPVTQIELNHLKKGRSTTKAQYDHDYPNIIENSITSKTKLFREMAKRVRKPQRTYMDAIPSVVPTQTPDNHEARLMELKLTNLRTLLPEDMVRRQEEVHFTALENRKGNTEKQLEVDVQRGGVPPQITHRRSAITSRGLVESKAPYMLELPAVQVKPPPQPRPLTLHPSNSIPQLIAPDHGHVQTLSAAVPRRVGSVGGAMPHMSTGQHNYVVVGQNDHTQALRVQRAEGISTSAGTTVFRSLASSQTVRRTPPATPMQQARHMNYVAQPSQSSGNYITNQQGGGTMYSTASPLTQTQRGPPPPSGRVVSRPGQQPQRIFVNSDRATSYVMQHSNHVRVVQGNAPVQRVQQVPKRMPPKGPGQMTTMVMPSTNRPAGGPPGGLQQFRTVRTIQRGGGAQPGTRVMVMGNNGQIRNAQGHLIGSGVTRQLLASRTIPSRTGSPQTIAQVVLAPGPASSHPSNPPLLTAQPMDTQPSPSAPPSQNDHI